MANQNRIIKTVSIAVIPYHDISDGVVMVKTRRDKCWGLPGGKMNLFEGSDYSVIREIREETGLEIVLIGVIGVYNFISDSGNHIQAVSYEGRAAAGRLQTKRPEEIEEVRIMTIQGLRLMHESESRELRSGEFHRMVIEDYLSRGSFPLDLVCSVSLR